MLTLTQNAAQMIADLTHQAELPAGGLRIALNDGPGLTMALVPEPALDDEVLHQHDVVVFLDPVAAGRLAGETLDGRTNEAGAAFFVEPRTAPRRP